jgi:hypothetical protein
MNTAFSIPFKKIRTKRFPQVVMLALTMLFLHSGADAAIMAVNLDSASGFAVLAGAGITVAAPVDSSTITGDIGTFPTTTITGLGNLILNGVNHAGDATTQQAKDDLDLAYSDAAGRTATHTYAPSYDLGGRTLTSGVYNDPSSFAISVTGDLTLDGGGDPNAVWIFQAGSTLTTASGSQVILTNGAQASNIFWQVGTAVTLGTGSKFSGTILAMDAITLTTGATVDGRALSKIGAVTLDQTTINFIPEPASLLLVLLAASTLFISFWAKTSRGVS